MVFESVVADLLNQFLGSYIDNLNAKQLNIGIWGGDVKLNNLEIKESALDDLDLPVRLKLGHVQSLVLKIPWKNLYTEPTVVNISELYLIIVPNQGIVYNEEKAQKNEQDTKQKKLARLEENRRNRNKPKMATDDTFTEKLVAQVIKNLQIRIKRVHVRYEDKFSNRDRPFATGVTLDSLDFQTTDEDFKLIVQREAVKIFYKLISMNHLGLYSNANSGLISDLTDKAAIVEALRNSIASEEQRPEGYKYVLEPLSIQAKLKLNQRPEADDFEWTVPKIDLSMALDKLGLAIGKFQYQDFLLFLEAQERFALSARYWKHRPNINVYRDHYKEWWHFAYNCILHEQVRRRRNNWSWSRMKHHREMVRQYKQAWIHYRTEKSPTAAIKHSIEEAERALDVFNLNIARQQAEFDIDRNEELVRVEDQQQEGWVGWAKSWFGGGGAAKKTETEHSETDAKIMDKLEHAVTPEEKQRLFDAIDYQENTPPTDYPKYFVENRFNFTLSTVIVALEDVLEMRFTDLSTNLEQRPSANAIKFDACVKTLEMDAVDRQPDEKVMRHQMLTMVETDRPWLALQFETNPLEADFDQFVGLEVAPIMFKYHAPAVNKTLDVFKPPESVRLHQLTALAIARYEDVKARSATALQHMVEERKKLKLEIKIDPTTIVLCTGGVFDEQRPALIAELGQLQMKTTDKPTERAYEHVKDAKLRALMVKAYDNFRLTLSNLQLIFAEKFDSCMQARCDRYSCHHLIKPTGMTIDILRSTIDDIQLPLIRCFGELPDLVFMLSDDRLVQLLELVNSIPRPQFEEEVVDLGAPLVDGTRLRDRAKMVAIMEVSELDELSLQQQRERDGELEEGENTGETPPKRKKSTKDGEEDKSETLIRERQVQLDLNLNLNEVGIIVNTKGRAFLSAHIRRLGFHMRKRMFDMVAQAHLGSLTVEMPQIGSSAGMDDGDSLYLIENEMREGSHLIDITYKQATHESPTFKTEFGSNEQSIKGFFQILNFNLHKNALSDLKNFNDRLQRKLARVQPPQIDQSGQQQAAMSTKKRTPSQSSRRSRDSSLDRKTAAKKKTTPIRSRPPVRPLQQKKFVFEFRMHEIAAKLYARQSDIAGGIDPDVNEDAILEFCALNIQKLELNGRMMEDGSMRVDIGLNAFTMDDRRKNARIKRLMDKKDTGSTDQFVTVKYSQNTGGDKFVDILSSKFFLMLAPEFLGVLSSFFTLRPDEDDEQEMEMLQSSNPHAESLFATPATAGGSNKTLLMPKETTGGGAASSSAKIASPQQTLAKAVPEQIAQQAAGTLTLNCKIYAIEVILIENSLRPEDSQAMILSFDAAIDAKNVDGIQQMQGGIQHLQVYSTYFAQEKRHLSNYTILKELDIRFTGSIDEKKKTQKFICSLDQVAIRVSPSVIRLLSAVSTQFSEHQKKDQAAKTARASLREFPGYFKPTTIEHEKYWWFRYGNDASGGDNLLDEIGEDAVESRELNGSQHAEFSINRFVVTVEAGIKDFTRPMIMMESTVHGTAQNWSSQLTADAEARLQVSYYNEVFNVWEPVIEPVLHEHSGWESWRLKLKVLPQDEAVEQQATSSKMVDNKEKKKAIPPAKMSVRIEAQEVMNITVTKSFLLLLNQLSDSFEKAAKQISPPKSRQLPGISSYLLVNETGLPIKVRNTPSLKASLDKKPVDCPMGQFVPMERIGLELGGGAKGHRRLCSGNWQMEEDQRKVELQLQLSDPDTERKVDILRAEMQCIDLPKEADSGKRWALVVDTKLENARHVVTLRSLVNIVNHLDMPVELRSIKDMEATVVGEAKSAEQPLNIPLPQLYTPDGEFSIRPVMDDTYDWSHKFSWHDFESTKRRTVRCDEKANTNKGIYVEIVVTEEKIRRGPRSLECSVFTAHLYPPIHFVNMLPMPVQLSEPIQREVGGGVGVDLYNLIAGLPFVLAVDNGGETFKLEMTIPVPGSKGELQVVKLRSTNSNKTLCLGLSWSTEFLRTTMSLYTPYWMVNETGKQLFYRQGTSNTDICHESGQNPLILPLSQSDFLDKKKAKLRIGDADWSAEFPLDTAGSSGRITCSSSVRDYELTVDVQLCQSGLTKVVTIAPFYMLQNDSKFAIEVREPNRSEWIKVPAESVIGFWPKQKANRKTLLARFPGTTEESVQFPFTETYEGFVRIDNKFVGLYIIVSVSDDSSVVHMEPFMPGMAPALLMNSTNFPIEYWQTEVEDKRTLVPGQMVPFAWDRLATGDSKQKPRFEWKSGDHMGTDELVHNRDLSYLPSKTDGYHFCVSFLNGRQRILLFTNDASVTFMAHEPFEMEQPNMEVQFSLRGVGISLVNNLKSIEVLYMAISADQQGKQEDGFWMQYRQSDHQTTLWVKLFNFQVDNQLPSSVFPCMLGMVPQPKSVVKNDPKPFLELSFVQNQSEHSNIVQIKLLEALVQEFSIRLDQVLINEILSLFPKESIETDYNQEVFAKDIELTHGNLNKRALQTRVSQAKAYYENMHISPLMIHLSFSQGHVKDEGSKKGAGAAIGIQWEFLNLMLKSVGVTLTEIQDVTFKLAFFQREATFYSRNQLQSEIQAHYIRQFIKQAYVLVLGLDIIGNPFGLIRDLSTGVQDFFYQPIQGAVTGPGEFVEGVTLGINSLFSHSVGGVLGVASRITGTLGKGVAALTLDEEYQRKRAQARQQPSNFGEGMARGVRAAGQGVFEGVTGVISKPMEGAKKGGISGFLKGTGKGLIGAVTRPVSGVVDLATSVADSVKTVVTNAEENKPIRPPRVISSDKIIRPFVYEEAIGYKIFKEINKGDFAEKDYFLTYGNISKNLVLVVTDKHVIEARQHELTGNWNADWSPTYSEMNKPEWIASPEGKFGVKITLKEARTSLFGRSKNKGKIILFFTESIARRVFDRMMSAWENAA